MTSRDKDIELFEAVKAKNRTAFDTLFRKYYPLLLSQAEQLVSEEDARNIVQDLMLDIWENSNKIQINSSLSAYLRKAIHYRCLNFIGHDSVHSRFITMTRLSVIEAANEVDFEDAMKLENSLDEALKQLPEVQREAFEMHRFRGLTYEQIAKLSSVSEKTIEYRISKALKFLRKYLKDFLE